MRRTWRTSLAIKIGIGVAALAGSGGSRLAGAAASPLRAPSARHVKGGSAPSRAPAPPDILLTGATRETRAVESRAAAFVRAVRGRDGARAARFLSRRTAARVRLAVARRDWPWRTAAQDLGLLFARRDLRLRTLALLREHARVRLAPQRRDPRSLEPAGFYDLGMVREGVRWQVLLPALGAPRTGARRLR